MASYFNPPVKTQNTQSYYQKATRPTKETTSRQAQTLSEEERARRNAMFQAAVGQLTPISQSLAAYYGPGGMSKWKQGQIQTRRSATTGAFNDARAGARRRANVAGFGYEQPATQTDELNIENARASQLARIPGDVEAEAVPIAQNAAALGTQAAGALAGIGASYDPMGYYGKAVDMTQLDKQIAQMEKDRRSSMWQNLLGIGSKIATSFLPVPK